MQRGLFGNHKVCLCHNSEYIYMEFFCTFLWDFIAKQWYLEQNMITFRLKVSE